MRKYVFRILKHNKSEYHAVVVMQCKFFMAEGSGGNLNLGQSALFRELRQYTLSGESVDSDAKRS